MDRRRFLEVLARGLAAAASTAVIDPEKLLWVPGAKTIITPPASGWTVAGASALRVGDVFMIERGAEAWGISRFQKFIVTAEVTDSQGTVLDMAAYVEPIAAKSAAPAPRPKWAPPVKRQRWDR